MRWVAALCASLKTLIISALATSGASQAQESLTADDAAWGAARQADTAEAYQGYLEQFPIGRHVEDAFRGLVEEQVESEFGVSRGLSTAMY